MKYYLIAGERSGDLHAGNLVKSIKEKDNTAVFQGFGGDYMKGAGVSITTHYADLAFMGFAEVIANLNKISRYIKICKHDILAFQPDVVVLVDYGGFNTRIAKFCKSQNFKVFYYITPKVWAWHQKRALTLKKNVDRMFVILPFEKDFYKKFDWQVDYVGNPVLDAIKSFKLDPDFKKKNDLPNDNTPVIALLPGSRKQELLSITPLFIEIVKRFRAFVFAVAAVGNLDRKLYKELSEQPNVRIVQDDSYNLLSISTAAIVTSGTATLETALLRVPQICVYKTSHLTYHIAKSFIRVSYLSLVNLILDKPAIKELIQSEANPDVLTKELVELISNDNYRTRIVQDYESLFKILDVGSASENAASLMVKYLREMN